MAALAAYRNIMRSARVAFANDMRMVDSARQQIRSGFEQTRNLDPSSKEYADAVQHANDVATILRKNVVQGQKIDGAEGEDRYKLNIHAETERGDNDSIKFAGKKMARAGDPQPEPGTQKCCSQ